MICSSYKHFICSCIKVAGVNGYVNLCGFWVLLDWDCSGMVWVADTMFRFCVAWQWKRKRNWKDKEKNYIYFNIFTGNVRILGRRWSIICSQSLSEFSNLIEIVCVSFGWDDEDAKYFESIFSSTTSPSKCVFVSITDELVLSLPFNGTYWKML